MCECEVYLRPNGKIMEFLADPVLWAGLFILIAIEVVLGIDNLALMEALTAKLPPGRRDTARHVGMCLALALRLGILGLFWHFLSFAAPLFTAGGFIFSLRSLLLLCGGLFLIFKATHGLHERLDSAQPMEAETQRPNGAGFWYITAQVAVLDAVFSMDAVITALGFMESLGLILVAVSVATPVAMLWGRRLAEFAFRRPTLQMLCLSYLLIVGLVMAADALGVHIPKGCIYAIIGFSMLLEGVKQILDRRRDLRLGHRSLRLRTAGTVLRFLGSGTTFRQQTGAEPQQYLAGEIRDGANLAGRMNLATGAGDMLYGVLTMGERHIRSIMTPRPEITWVDLEDTPAEIREAVRQSQHNVYPVRRSSTDEVLGVVYGKDLVGVLPEEGEFSLGEVMHPPVFVQESVGILRLMEVLRATRAKMVLITEEYGSVVGLVTPLDIFEVIAGEFPEEDEDPDFTPDGDNAWQVDGGVDLHRLEMLLDTDILRDKAGGYVTLGGYLMHNLGRLPQPGDTLTEGNLYFEVLKATDRKVDLVRVVRKTADGQ